MEEQVTLTVYFFVFARCECFCLLIFPCFLFPPVLSLIDDELCDEKDKWSQVIEQKYGADGAWMDHSLFHSTVLAHPEWCLHVFCKTWSRTYPGAKYQAGTKSDFYLEQIFNENNRPVHYRAIRPLPTTVFSLLQPRDAARDDDIEWFQVQRTVESSATTKAATASPAAVSAVAATTPLHSIEEDNNAFEFKIDKKLHPFPQMRIILEGGTGAVTNFQMR